MSLRARIAIAVAMSLAVLLAVAVAAVGWPEQLSLPRLVWGGAIVLLLLPLLSVLLGDYLARRFALLEAAARRITQGEAGHQIPVVGDDELAQAARAFNTMSQQFAAVVDAKERALDDTTRVADQIREREEHYRVLFNGNRAVALLLDPDDGRIIDANRAAIDFYGYGLLQLRRMRISDINPMDPAALAQEIALARAEARNHFFFRHRLASGEIRDVEVHSGPIMIGGRQRLYSIIHDVTARVQAERTLRENEQRYRAVVRTTAEGYMLLDTRDKTIIEVNDALCAMFGYRADELIGHQPTEFADEANQSIMREQMDLIPHTEHRSFEVGFIHKEGRPVTVHISSTTLRDEQGAPCYSFGFFSDITAQRQAESDLRLAATFMENTSEAIMITDASNRIVTVNPAFCNITGYRMDEVVGENPRFLHSGRHNRAFYQQMWDVLLRMGRWQGEIWNRRKSGEIYPEWLSIVALRDNAGVAVQYMAIFSDITRRKRDEQKIWQQANFDALTGLPNRTLFMDRLSQAMQAAHHEGWMVALMFIDLDRFKWVNDTLGHTVGDHLLQEVARCLKGCISEMDTVARLGGDEFTIALSDVRSIPAVEQVAERILQQLSEPLIIDGHETFISASIGITFYPRDATVLEELLRNADGAMYRAKQAGRNTFRYYTQEMNDEAQRRLLLEHDLRRALGRGECAVHYQPIIGWDDEIVGAEALMRWEHPQLGEIPPDEFIQLAEEIGMIVSLGEWVLEQALAECGRWHSAGHELFVSVNVSSEQCLSSDFLPQVCALTEAAGLPTDWLKLEITERLMMEDSDQVRAMLSRFRERGVHLAVDDFGTGYSSLSYLRRFPVDMLKIDREFIDDLPHNPDNVALVEAIIAMAHSLGLEVVAEGVEMQEQQRFLAARRCDMLQGFFYGRPLDAANFMQYLEAGEAVRQRSSTL